MPDFWKDDQRWTTEGQHANAEICQALKPVIKKYLDEGYALRDIMHLAMHAVMSQEMHISLGMQINAYHEKVGRPLLDLFD